MEYRVRRATAFDALKTRSIVSRSSRPVPAMTRGVVDALAVVAVCEPVESVDAAKRAAFLGNHAERAVREGGGE